MLNLLITPLAKGAYFNDLEVVARAELTALYPAAQMTLRSIGPLELFEVDLPESCAPSLMRLSWVQGIFKSSPDQAEREIKSLECLEVTERFELPESLVWGSKYRGKTHELVTQLALNLAIAHAQVNHKSRPALLDPMAGRGTTLLWAARYGMSATGIELDSKSVEHVHRDLKRQTKLHKIKHSASRGTLGQGKRGAPYVLFEWPIRDASDDRVYGQIHDQAHDQARVKPQSRVTTKLIAGDCREVSKLTANQRFHHIVSDLPYGVQFTGGSRERSPLELLREALPAWVDALRPGGSLVLIFNALQPRRVELEQLISGLGLELSPWHAPHRMSESIKRDLIVARRPLTS